MKVQVGVLKERCLLEGGKFRLQFLLFVFQYSENILKSEFKMRSSNKNNHNSRV